MNFTLTSIRKEKKSTLQSLTSNKNYLATFLLSVILLLVSSVGMGQKNYSLVTSTSGLEAGAKYLVVNGQSGNVYALGYQNTNNRPRTTSAFTVASSQITVTAATISTNQTAAYELTLGGSSGAWTLYDAVNSIYLSSVTGSNNYLKSGAGTWTISFSSNAAIMTCSIGTRNVLQYNSSATLFSCYTSGQSSVYLYKEVASSTAPTVTSSAATSISSTGATLNGNVTSDGGATITERGFVYKTSSGVTISDNKTTVAGTTGSYSLTPSLAVNTHYYFKAYATNSVNTTLSTPELDFWTLANVPTAPTVNNPTATTLDIAINVNLNPSTTTFAIQENGGQYVQADGSLGGSAVWQTASVWGTKTVIGLSSNTTYNFKVKARNGANTETAFSSIASETTLEAPSDPTIILGGGPLVGLSTTYGTASSYSTFTVSGTALDGDINILAPTGFEVSTSASSGYSSSIDLPETGGIVASTTIYVRLQQFATVAGSPYGGDIELSSLNAGTETIATASSTVSTKELTITGLTGENKTYNGGTSASVTGTATLSGVVNSDDVSLSGTPSYSFATKTAGTAKAITVSGYTLSGSDISNYSLTQPSGVTADIEALELTVSGAEAQDKTYNGTTAAVITGATLVGVIGLDDVSVSGGGAFADANAGEDKEVTAALSLSGDDAVNYTLEQPAGLTATINKANQTITGLPSTDTKTTATTTYSLTATAPGGTVTYTSSDHAVATISGSTVTIHGAGTTTITASQSGNTNYNAATDVTQTLTVTAAPITIVTFPSSWSGTPSSAPSVSQNGNINGTVTVTRGSALTAVSSSARYNSSNWQTGTTISFATNNYITFTVTAATGYKLNLNSAALNFTLGASGSGPTKYGVYTSVGGFASSAAQVGADLTNSSTSVTFPASGYDNLSTIEIRIYGWNASATGGTGGFASMNLTGNLVSVPLAPTATTGAATSITTSGATLNGTITANNASTTVSFNYGETESYGSTTSGTPSPITGSTPTAVSGAISGLSVNTHYNFRVSGTNSVNTSNGSNASFWTLANVPSAPIVDNATIHTLDVTIGTGDGNPSNTTYAIQEIGGQYVQADGSLGASAVWQTASAWGTVTVTSLASSTEFTFQVKARNGANVETAFGSSAAETTETPASPTLSVSGTLSGLSTTYGTASSYTTFTVSGSALEGNINVLAPTGFEVSESETTGYSSSIDLIETGGTVSATTIYVRLQQYAPVAGSPYSGDIEISTSGAGTETIATASSTVSTKELTITGLTGENKTYDGGTSASVTGTATLSGVVNSDDVSLSGTPSYSFATKTVGTAKAITASGFTLSGSDMSNYSLTQPSGVTADIEALELTVSGAAAQDKTYDGATAAVITGATLVGVIGLDDVSVSGGGSFVDANAGDDKDVTASLSLSGDDATNYTLTQPTGLTATINKASQTIIGLAATDTKTTATAPYALTATAPGGTVSYSSSNHAVATISGSTVTIVGAGSTTITASQAGNTNYNAAADVTQTLTVTVEPSVVTWNFGTSAPGNANPSSGTPVSNLTISAISQGNNNGTTTLLNTGSASSGYTGASASYNAGAAARTGAINTGTSAYFEFTLTPSADYKVVLSQISFGSRSTSTGPANYALRTSLDNYATNVATGSLSPAATPSWTLESNSSLNIESSVATPITYRIYGFGGTGSPSAGTANWRIDDLNISVLPVYVCLGYTWQGTADADFNNPDNWKCGVVPPTGSDISVEDGETLVIAENITVGDIDLGTGSVLDLNGYHVTIEGTITDGQIKGSATSDLTISATANVGTLNFVSGGQVLHNLTVNSNAALGTPLALTAGTEPGTLVVGAGATFTTNNNLTIKSDLGGTARVGISAGTIEGNVEVERYVRQNTNRGWRLLSVPTKTSQTIYQSWQESGVNDNGFGTLITSNAIDATNYGYDRRTPGNSMLTYNPTGGGSEGAWVGMTAPTTSTNIETTSGYMLYIRGNRATDISSVITSPTAAILRTKGELYQGTQTAISVAADRSGLIGNIYPSEIDFTQLNRTGGIDNKFYVWDPQLNGIYGLGDYQVFSADNPVGAWKPVPGGGSFGTTASSKIQSGAAFFVRATGSAGTIQLTENAKSTGKNNNSLGFRPTASVSYLQTELHRVTQTEYIGQAVVGFSETYNDAIDGKDALRPSFGSSEGIAIQKPSAILMIEQRQNFAETADVEFQLANLKKQKYRLDFVTGGFVNQGFVAFVEDNYLSTSTSVNLDGTITSVEFDADPAIVASFKNRFKVVFRPSGTVPVRFTTVKATQQGTAMQVEWTVAAETGITKYEVEHSTNGTNFTKVGEQTAQANTGATVSYSWLDATPAAGINYYRVKSVNASGEVVYTTIVKVVNGQVISSIVLVSNPVRNNVINMQFNNQEKGNYVVKVMDSKGQQVVIDRVAHTGGNATVGINLPSVAKGMYQVEVQSPNTSRKSFKVVVE